MAEVERQFSFIEAAERAVSAALVRSAGLRRSVLKAAFEGRLVPQDPSDEPASVLLERIAAERAAAPQGVPAGSGEGGGVVSESSALVAKLWNYCHVLRDDGVSTIEYVEQLTYLLFLKMADERARGRDGAGRARGAGLAVAAGPRR